MAAELVVDHIWFPEGLAWSATTGCLICSACQDGSVWRIWPNDHRKELIARLGGGANNVVLDSDDGCVVAQNGGIDAHKVFKTFLPHMPPAPPPSSVTPGLVHLTASGDATYLQDTGLNAPGDVAVAPDGSLVLTDPGLYLDERAGRRVMRFSRENELEVVADGFAYCNGIATIGDSILVTDLDGVYRLDPDGERYRVVETEHPADGLAVDSDGRLYLAAGQAAGITIVEDGRIVEFLPLPPGDGFATNCTFGGPDGKWLFASDGLYGKVVVFPDMPVCGQPETRWAAPPPA